MQDIHIESKNNVFKLRVSGIFIQDNKLLVVQHRNNNFCCLPGGHIEIGEDSKSAVIREMKEETLLNLTVSKLLCIAENIYTIRGKKVHELCYYYIMKSETKVETKNWSYIEMDKGHETPLNFYWYDLSDQNSIQFKPYFILNKLKLHNSKFEHIIKKQ